MPDAIARGRHRWAALILVTLSTSCQVLGGYETFEPPGAEEVDGPEPHRCRALPRTKADLHGTTTMLLIEGDEDRCFWIDSTEVTVGAYQSFLNATGGRPTWDAQRCGWKDAASDPRSDPEHACSIAAEQLDAVPFSDEEAMRCVDWCDAEAYCRWGGKHLCYTYIPQQTLGWETPRNVDDWAQACAGPEARPYPYGDKAAPGVCNVGMTVDQCLGLGVQGGCFPAPAASFTGCSHPGGPINMIGNVAEWASGCFPRGVPDEPCFVRGGAFDGGLTDTSCYSQFDRRNRDTRSPAVGIRCCAELSPEEEASTAQ